MHLLSRFKGPACRLFGQTDHLLDRDLLLQGGPIRGLQLWDPVLFVSNQTEQPQGKRQVSATKVKASQAAPVVQRRQAAGQKMPRLRICTHWLATRTLQATR